MVLNCDVMYKPVRNHPDKSCKHSWNGCYSCCPLSLNWNACGTVRAVWAKNSGSYQQAARCHQQYQKYEHNTNVTNLQKSFLTLLLVLSHNSSLTYIPWIARSQYRHSTGQQSLLIGGRQGIVHNCKQARQNGQCGTKKVFRKLLASKQKLSPWRSWSSDHEFFKGRLRSSASLSHVLE